MTGIRHGSAMPTNRETEKYYFVKQFFIPKHLNQRRLSCTDSPDKRRVPQVPKCRQMTYGDLAH